MKLVRRHLLSLAGAAAADLVAPQLTWAQSYPARPVRLIVPYAAGGPTDVFARIVAQKLSDNLGKQFYIENVAGASGNIGIGRGAKAAADGYTMLIVPTNYVVNPALFGTGKWNRVLIDATMNLDYDPDPDLGGARFPPTVWPKEEDIEAARKRWAELGFEKIERD